LYVLARAAALLIQRDGRITTTVFSRVADAFHHAVTHNPGNWSTCFPNAITAVTLSGIFKASDRESFARAVVNASLDSHLIVALVVAGQNTCDDAVRTTTGILPLLRHGQIGKVRFRGANGVWCTAITLRDRFTWTILYGIAPGERVQIAEHVFVDRRWDPAAFGLAVWDETKNLAVFDITTLGGAGVDGILKGWNVPAVDLTVLADSLLRRKGKVKGTYEIAMISIASRIALSPDKRLGVSVPFIGEIVDIPDDLIKERDQVLGVRAGASAVVVASRVRDVRLVVRRIEVDAIPARREIDLGA